jgi:hypothetical protein
MSNLLMNNIYNFVVYKGVKIILLFILLFLNIMKQELTIIV